MKQKGPRPVSAVGSTRKAGAALRRVALRYPGVHEDFPWGERALKVQKKVFLFLRYDASQLSLSVKLPASHRTAVMFSFAEPTGYGLAKSGWVTARFTRGSSPPLRLLEDWVKESYRAVAPLRLAALVTSEKPTRVPSLKGRLRPRMKTKA